VNDPKNMAIVLALEKMLSAAVSEETKIPTKISLNQEFGLPPLEGKEFVPRVAIIKSPTTFGQENNLKS